MPESTALNPAERAAEAAMAVVYACIEHHNSFRLEAGAGAGKTHSLITALKYVIAREGLTLGRRNQRIACITYTNVAKGEIEARTDRHRVVHCDTIHGFCWSLLKDLQAELRKELPKIEKCREKLDEVGGIGNRLVVYTLGHRKVKDEEVSIHHDDVLALFVALMEQPKFRALLTARYPILFIDEYQDTNRDVAGALIKHFLSNGSGPLIGLFGDHWQKIYDGVCGSIDHAALKPINKGANFRSVHAVVDVLNRMRPELPQEVTDPVAEGFVAAYHTNQWGGRRRTESQWKDDLPPVEAHGCLASLKEHLASQGWNFDSEETKILMLTHTVLATEQGYGNLAAVFPYNDSFIKKEDDHIAFFADLLEPVCAAYHDRRFGQMFAALARGTPAITSHQDKVAWTENMNDLLAVRESGTVGDVIDFLRRTGRPRLPESVERRERERERLADAEDGEVAADIQILLKLRQVPYREVVALTAFIDGHTPFSTKHGVKGAQFENVLVVVGRGWNKYDFNRMLEWAPSPSTVPADKREFFERARNLFYVVCSRPKKRLAVLFTQRLSNQGLATLTNWFGAEGVHPWPVP
jgi:DNA helicase-2/ATP-dependent DNA helicase PcrA